uniref:Uncharacterized protein n=1 Tax=viral metagenome TaxID=1070528 RepID=A0A6M3LJZ6_9ZZZZ
MPRYDYLCPEGHCVERTNSYDVSTIPCPICNKQAIRQSVYLFTPVTETGVKVSRLNPTPRNEKRYDVTLFQEACAEREYSHKKAEESVQHALPSENLWQTAKKRADAILKGDAPPVKAQTRFKEK